MREADVLMSSPTGRYTHLKRGREHFAVGIHRPRRSSQISARAVPLKLRIFFHNGHDVSNGKPRPAPMNYSVAIRADKRKVIYMCLVSFGESRNRFGVVALDEPRGPPVSLHRCPVQAKPWQFLDQTRLP